MRNSSISGVGWRIKMRLIKFGMLRREIPFIEWYIHVFFLILTKVRSITFTRDLRPFRRTCGFECFWPLEHLLECKWLRMSIVDCKSLSSVCLSVQTRSLNVWEHKWLWQSNNFTIRKRSHLKISLYISYHVQVIGITHLSKHTIFTEWPIQFLACVFVNGHEMYSLHNELV